MRIYQKYLTSIVFMSFLVLMIIMTGFAWIAQILRMIYLLEKGVGLLEFLQILPLLIPSLLFTLMPLITVISVIYSYDKLYDLKELIILRASGISNINIIRPALFVILLVTAATIYLGAHLMPLSHNLLKNQLYHMRNNYVIKSIEPQTFQQISKKLTIYVASKDQNNVLHNVIIFINEPVEEKGIIFAKQGQLIDDQGSLFLKLQSGVREAYDSKGNLTKLYFEHSAVELKNILGEYNHEREISTSEFTLWQLLWPSPELYSDNMQKKMILEAHQRIMWPLYNYVFALTALSIFLSRSYKRKSDYKIILLSFVPAVFLAYIHFTLRKLSYQDSNLIFLGYANIALVIGFCTWYNKRQIV